MNTGECGQLPPDLVRARNQFQAWRGRRKAGEPIPQALWDLAVRLAIVHGVSRTATVLEDGLVTGGADALSERAGFVLAGKSLGEGQGGTLGCGCSEQYGGKEGNSKREKDIAEAACLRFSSNAIFLS
jgi:hypothetical protein